MKLYLFWRIGSTHLALKKKEEKKPNRTQQTFIHMGKVEIKMKLCGAHL